jgi:hypothetical protein
MVPLVVHCWLATAWAFKSAWIVYAFQWTKCLNCSELKTNVRSTPIFVSTKAYILYSWSLIQSIIHVSELRSDVALVATQAFAIWWCWTLSADILLASNLIPLWKCCGVPELVPWSHRIQLIGIGGHNEACPSAGEAAAVPFERMRSVQKWRSVAVIGEGRRGGASALKRTGEKLFCIGGILGWAVEGGAPLYSAWLCQN